MDAIQFLLKDHRAVRQLFRRFGGTRNKAAKKNVAERLIIELSKHAAVEEQLLYPAVRQMVDDSDPLVLRCLEEHHVAKLTLEELSNLDPEHERYAPKVEVLSGVVLHHLDQEEAEVFPQLRKALGKKPLADLGSVMARARRAAPSRPHPRAPDAPPANLVAGPAAGMVDRGLDFIRSLSSPNGRRELRAQAARSAKQAVGRARKRTPRVQVQQPEQ
jgi:hemerythrin superfamily protein